MDKELVNKVEYISKIIRPTHKLYHYIQCALIDQDIDILKGVIKNFVQFMDQECILGKMNGHDCMFHHHLNYPIYYENYLNLCLTCA